MRYIHSISRTPELRHGALGMGRWAMFALEELDAGGGYALVTIYISTNTSFAVRGAMASCDDVGDDTVSPTVEDYKAGEGSVTSTAGLYM
jgi:hypothetical protein